MFVGNYSYDNTIFQIPKKRLRGCSLVISLPIDTKTSYMHARPSSIQRGKGCDVFIRVRESLTTGTQDFEFSISTIPYPVSHDSLLIDFLLQEKQERLFGSPFLDCTLSL